MMSNEVLEKLREKDEMIQKSLEQIQSLRVVEHLYKEKQADFETQMKKIKEKHLEEKAKLETRIQQL